MIHKPTEPRPEAEEEYELVPGDERSYGEGDGPVILWRMSCFEALGFGALDALVLAIRRDVDREEVRRLREAGATEAQVAGIVL